MILLNPEKNSVKRVTLLSMRDTGKGGGLGNVKSDSVARNGE